MKSKMMIILTIVLILVTFAEKMVQTERDTTFPLVYRLIEVALILPVATTTVERDSSAMILSRPNEEIK